MLYFKHIPAELELLCPVFILPLTPDPVQQRHIGAVGGSLKGKLDTVASTPL